MTRMIQPETRSGKRILGILWPCQLIISAHFVAYIDLNEGSITGDYGTSYRAQQKQKTPLDAR